MGKIGQCLGKITAMEEMNMVVQVVSIISVVVAPIVAVWIGQYLQDRANKRKDKMELFKTLMISRAIGMNLDTIRSYNMIDIVFMDSAIVREQWMVYYSTLDSKNFDAEKIKKERYKLLETMAKDLGYKDKITWETIQYPYIPKWLLDEMEKQEVYKKGQVDFAKLVTDLNKDSLP